MAKYVTRQRRLLLDYLAGHADESLSAGQIAAALTGAGISVSAVYRNLAALEREGQVERIAAPGSQAAVYRYAAAEGCRGHLHLSCTHCGRSYHMAACDTQALVQDVARQEGFAVDSERTVFYGTCAKCMEQRG